MHESDHIVGQLTNRIECLQSKHFSTDGQILSDCQILSAKKRIINISSLTSGCKQMRKREDSDFFACGKENTNVDLSSHTQVA